METTKEIEHHLKANTNLPLHDVILMNFIGGLSWGAGSVIGAIIIVAVLGYILSLLGVFDSISSFITQITNLNQQFRQVPRF